MLTALLEEVLPAACEPSVSIPFPRNISYDNATHHLQYLEGVEFVMGTKMCKCIKVWMRNPEKEFGRLLLQKW